MRKTKTVKRSSNRFRLLVAALIFGALGSYLALHTFALVQAPDPPEFQVSYPTHPTVGQTAYLGFMTAVDNGAPAFQTVNLTVVSDSSHLQYTGYSCASGFICTPGTPDSPDSTLHTDVAVCITYPASAIHTNAIPVLSVNYKVLQAGPAKTNYLGNFYNAACGAGTRSTLVNQDSIPVTMDGVAAGTNQHGPGPGDGGTGTGTSGGTGSGSGRNGSGSGASGSGSGTNPSTTSSAASSNTAQRTSVSTPTSSPNISSHIPQPIPSTTAQGTQTQPPEQQPSPFYDGTAYSPGSDSSDISLLVPRHHVQTWALYLGWGGAVVLLAGGGYVWWRRWQLKPKAK